ncbi:hypothetical protein [Tenacibaculum sp. nBUS_03]|uniref:hypothetical protein n=1 Tax=Tenacibaculum sp. nBUS_03 TaxID=3395320 RepID=UPI003EBA46D6
MKHKLFYILFLLTLSISYAQSSMVKIEADTTNIRIGEQFEYKITINETENVIIPELENLKGLEIIDSLKIDTINSKLIKKYKLTGFDSGAFYIPRQQIFIKNQPYFTDSLLINVATIAIDTTKRKKFPIKGIIGEPYIFDDFKIYIYWALALLLIAISTLYFALKRTDNSSSKTFIPKLAPYQEALRNLKLLDEKLLWQNNKTKAYYSELTAIVRTYIERELNVPALEQTTNELVESLVDFSNSKSIVTDKETINKLKSLLQQSDLVKFAKSKPMAHEIEADRNITTYIINNLKPSISEENSETSYSKPVVIVQKPEINNPKIMIKLLLLAITFLIVFLISFGVYKAISSSNPIKQPVENVQ